jgi:diguanylate cyclase (GGDEF)-like protein
MLSSIFDKITVENKEHLIRHLKNMTEPGAKKVYEFGIGKEDGTYGYIMAEACVVQLSNGERIQIHCLTDITEKRKLETQLLQMSETDPLTHISNRRSGEARIQALLKSGKGGMLCLLDVDHFKKVNDTYGHSAGDQVLVSIASCLQNSFREQDVIMRLGGDEFAIYALRIADEETGERCIQRFFREVEKIHIDEIGDHRISVTLGAVLCPSNDEQEYNVLYKKADQAMYGKKNESGNQYDFYRGES